MVIVHQQDDFAALRTKMKDEILSDKNK